MGGAASVQSNQPSYEELKQVKSPRASIKNQFEREFGKRTSEDRSNERSISVSKIEESSKNEFNINPALFRAKKLFMKPILEKRPAVKNLVIRKQNNGALLKELFRRMDPTLPMENTNRVVGEIEVAVKYKILEETILVRVGRAKKLQKTDTIGLPDPYVTIDLFSKNEPTIKITKSTSSKSNTCEPSFDEILAFPLEQRKVVNSRLCVSLWDKDLIGHDDFLGESIFDVCKLDLNAGDTMWYQLHQKTDTTISGSIDVTLLFTQPNILTATLHQANNMKVANRITERSNPFARIYVSGLPDRIETKVKENTLNPIWEETIDFLIHPDEFPKRIIVFNILSREVGQIRRLGDVHIALNEFDISTSGARTTYQLQDLRNTPHTRSKWSEEGLALEFHEAMRAHATYGYPKFLYKKQHQGKMLISVHNEKAHTQAKMVIFNGIPTEYTG